FSIANDAAKYFAIIPAAFATTYPVLNALNIMHLATPQSAILSAVIFYALNIIALIPPALKGVRYRAIGAAAVLRRHVWIYGIGGIIIPLPGLKLGAIDLGAPGPGEVEGSHVSTAWSRDRDAGAAVRADGSRLPGDRHRDRPSRVSTPGERQPHRQGRQGDRLGADRPAVR